MREKALEVPMPAICFLDRIIREPVQFVQFQAGAVINPRQHTPAACPEVNRQTYFLGGQAGSSFAGRSSFPPLPCKARFTFFTGARSVIKVSMSSRPAKK